MDELQELLDENERLKTESALYRSLYKFEIDRLRNKGKTGKLGNQFRHQMMLYEESKKLKKKLAAGKKQTVSLIQSLKNIFNIK
jgi:hypothetical protein|nr:MAG TPA: hypothetical protein [Caudoviricetes sp.]